MSNSLENTSGTPANIVSQKYAPASVKFNSLMTGTLVLVPSAVYNEIVGDSTISSVPFFHHHTNEPCIRTLQVSVSSLLTRNSSLATIVVMLSSGLRNEIDSVLYSGSSSAHSSISAKAKRITFKSPVNVHFSKKAKHLLVFADAGLSHEWLHHIVNICHCQ